MRKLIFIMLLCSISMSVSSEDGKALPFSIENLIVELNKSDIQYKDIVLAQSILETGHYTSEIFKHGNNLIGMKLAKKRPTTATGTYKGYATYSSWYQSLEDYNLWQKNFSHKFKTREQFLAFLNLRYSQDGSYAKKLLSVLKKHKTLLAQMD